MNIELTDLPRAPYFQWFDGKDSAFRKRESLRMNDFYEKCCKINMLIAVKQEKKNLL